MTRLIAALVASAVTALIMVGAVALGALCIGLGWAVAQIGMPPRVAGWVVTGTLGVALIGVWWACYRDALARTRAHRPS